MQRQTQVQGQGRWKTIILDTPRITLDDVIQATQAAQLLKAVVETTSLEAEVSWVRRMGAKALEAKHSEALEINELVDRSPWGCGCGNRSCQLRRLGAKSSGSFEPNNW